MRKSWMELIGATVLLWSCRYALWAFGTLFAFGASAGRDGFAVLPLAAPVEVAGEPALGAPGWADIESETPSGDAVGPEAGAGSSMGVSFSNGLFADSGLASEMSFF